MPETIFIADSSQVLVSAFLGIVLLLLLIIKFKINPILSLLVSALFIGIGSGMSVAILARTIEIGAGKTLQGIVLLIGLGSMFGGILETSGGAQRVAQTLVGRFGESKAGIALGVTGLLVGTAVFFEAGVMILVPLAFSLAKKTGKSTFFYVIPLLSGLATGFAFIPPSVGSVLVANLLGVDLGLMILVGLPTGILSLIFSGVIWAKFVGERIYVPPHAEVEIKLDPLETLITEKDIHLPTFSTVLCIILTPLLLILLSTLTNYTSIFDPIKSLLLFLGTPFIALIIAIFLASFLLGTRQGYSNDQIKNILESALKPTANILLVITGGGIMSEVLQVCGMGDIVGSVLEKSGLPLILVSFLIAALIRICVGSAIVAMTMATGIMISMPAIASLPPLYLAAMVLAINGGSSAFSHVNDSGFWLVSSLLKIDEATTLKSWTVMETILGFVGLFCALIIATFA